MSQVIEVKFEVIKNFFHTFLLKLVDKKYYERVESKYSRLQSVVKSKRNYIEFF